MSYRALVSKLFDAPEDRALAGRWAARLQADGVRAAQIEALLHEASRVSTRPDGSQMTPEESVKYLGDFARVIGVTEAQVEGSSKWWHDGGPEPAPVAAPTEADDRAIIAKAEALLAKDAKGYWADRDLVAKYSAALERRAAAPAPTAADLGEVAPVVDDWAVLRQRARADTRRFEDMLADPEGSRKYWASAELRAQYSQAIQRAQDIEAAAAAPPPPPTTLAGGADVAVPAEPAAAAAAAAE
jgi:hypothetical protein